MKNEEILNIIQKISEELGFDLVGIANTAISPPAQAGDEQLAVSNNKTASLDYLLTMTGEKLDEWIRNGYHADMKWFADSVEKRKDILKVMPDAKSVICVAINYYDKKNSTSLRYSEDLLNSGTFGNIARYAYGRDYHKIFDKKLKLFVQKLKEIFPNGDFKYYSDTGPVLERAWAVKAGLGFIGKNTNLITKYGSWVLLGEIIVNKKLLNCSSVKLLNSKNNSAIQQFSNDCGSCRRCLDACPTGALRAPYTVDARKCISYLTIEHKGDIPMELREKMGLPGQGNRIFGCDICQEVCPFNIGRSAVAKAMADKAKAKNELTEKPIAGSTQDLKEILSIKTDEEFLKKFAGSPVMRAKRRGLVRNACVVAGNSKNKTLLPYLKECLNDSEFIIVSHAKWAIDKIEHRS